MHLDLETNDLDFNINPKFAQKYEHRKKREELSQLEHKYASDESCSDIEDDDGVLVTPQVDAQILNTIALIRSKDAAVYDPKTVFFDDETEAPILEKPDKPITLKTYHQNELLNTEKPVVTHAQMQEDVKTEFLAAVKELDDSAEDIFTIRKHDKDEIKEQDKQYSKFLLENIDSSNPNVRAIEEWKQTTDPDEAFLLDFVLNRGWIDKNANHVPSYSEIIDDTHDASDEEAVEAAEEFESTYNFRFEQAGSSQVITHARDVPDTLRRKDDTRINQRNDRKLRKQQEKKLKQEELKRLKNLKMEEIKKKLAQIQELAGGEALGFDNADIEDDFDPEAYDNKMQESFGNDYYSAKDPLRKPVFEDDIEIDDIVPAPKKSKTFKESKLIAPCDEEDFNMDADYQPDVKTSATEIKEFREKEQMEELYRLDYEDIIAGQPVRFKYRTVEPNNYGLKIDELLEAEDQDLNAVVSLKKMAPFRPEAKKQQDAQKWKKYKKKKLWEFRSKLIGRVLTKNEPEVVPEKKSSDKAAVGEQRLNAYKSGKNH